MRPGVMYTLGESRERVGSASATAASSGELELMMSLTRTSCGKGYRSLQCSPGEESDSENDYRDQNLDQADTALPSRCCCVVLC